MHFADFHSNYTEQNCHVLVVILYKLNLACQHIIEGKLKILETNQKSEEILHIYLIIFVSGDFYCDLFKRNIHASLRCTKTRSPRIGTVSH